MNTATIAKIAFIAFTIAGIALALMPRESQAATETNVCNVYKLDIQAELKRRNYSTSPTECHAEALKQGEFKVTVVASGNKEVMECNPKECN